MILAITSQKTWARAPIVALPASIRLQGRFSLNALSGVGLAMCLSVLLYAKRRWFQTSGLARYSGRCPSRTAKMSWTTVLPIKSRPSSVLLAT
jgi:hypothetical protein